MKITSENAEQYYKTLPANWHPAERDLQTIHDFLKQHGFQGKENTSFLTDVIAFLEERLPKLQNG